MFSDQPTWVKALLLAGGAAASAGLIWYLIREGEDDEEEEGKTSRAPPGTGQLFKVADARGASIGIREGPDLNSARTGQSLYPNQVFRVSEIVQGPGEQRYLLLEDGRGWVFTHSGRDGRMLTRECMPGEEEEMPQNNMMEMMMQAQQMLAANPELREQVMQSQHFQQMMQNPEMMQQMAMQSPAVSQALAAQPELREQLLQDPSAVMGALGR